jgi:transposase
MDVRAKQRLSYHVAWLFLAGLVAVSPHVISTVRRFLVTPNLAEELSKLELRQIQFPQKCQSGEL